MPKRRDLRSTLRNRLSQIRIASREHNGVTAERETAAFEENQGNVPHAKQLYQELVNLYPSTKVAEIARARLAELDSKK
ncbi:MAG: hypothetical protein HZC50_06085 [Nitrospirae bacterium]|nr:hypothetical protein [Nitrospirota bacterium]